MDSFGKRIVRAHCKHIEMPCIGITAIRRYAIYIYECFVFAFAAESTPPRVPIGSVALARHPIPYNSIVCCVHPDGKTISWPGFALTLILHYICDKLKSQYSAALGLSDAPNIVA